MDYVLTTNCLDKRYRNFQALNGLTMHIPKGAIYGFIGKNGAGKTTLIRLVCGLQTPDSGSYTLYGRKHTDREIVKSRRRMGAVVETPSVYQDMTAEVTFVTDEVSEVLYIPVRAVIQENGEDYVKVREEDGKIVRKEVSTGFTDGINIEIKEGLSEGETVLTETKVSS